MISSLRSRERSAQSEVVGSACGCLALLPEEERELVFLARDVDLDLLLRLGKLGNFLLVVFRFWAIRGLRLILIAYNFEICDWENGGCQITSPVYGGSIIAQTVWKKSNQQVVDKTAKGF